MIPGRLGIAKIVDMRQMRVLAEVDELHLPRLVPGAPVEVLGPHVSPDDLAELARTNGYEIMTSLGRRYHRAYVESRDDAAGEET